MNDEFNVQVQNLDPEISESESEGEFEKKDISKVLTIIWIFIIYSESVILQHLSSGLNLPQSVLFTVIIILHILLYLHAHRVAKYFSWAYFVVQGGLIFSSAFLLPDSFSIVLVGLMPILVGQSIGIYYKPLKVILVFLISYVLFCVAVVWHNDGKQFVLFIPLFFLIAVVIIAYVILFLKQVQARIHTQNVLKELEIAHQKVEELTIANERQRMARDLHDTLAQGLAGLIMQLEAIDAHLTKGSTQRAQEIVQQSMSQVRRTLSDSRRAIDNLRSKTISEVDFAEAVEEEIQRFTMATSIRVIRNIKIKASVPRLLFEHGLFIISECLTNVAKHSHANTVWINILDNEGKIEIEIRDDGKGFDTDIIAKQTGHYGIIGIHERVRMLGGKINISSIFQEGTAIKIEAPLTKGDLS